MNERPVVVVIGAGFAGLTAARTLRGVAADVVLVASRNYHTFQPLLYQVATAALEPEEIAHAVRGIFQRQRNLRFRLAAVTGVDFAASTIAVRSGPPVRFDYLILAAGADVAYFDVPGAAEHALPLKSLEDAVLLRGHVIRQFEAASTDPALIDAGVLNFVLVGGGPTGVEMAGSLVEWFDRVIARDFPSIDIRRARVIVVEALDRLVAPFDEQLRRYTFATLQRRGVDIRLGEAVTRVEAETVALKSGEAIPTRTVVWTAGVRASHLADALGVSQGRGRRITVEPDLSIPGHPRVFVAGDLAASTDAAGQPYPQLAQVAIQTGRHAARQIVKLLAGAPTERFVYKDPGIMAVIGRGAAIAQFPFGLRLTGFPAWLVWLFLHLMYLVGFRNRLNVLINWAWNYFTYDRSARLIMELSRPKETDHEP
jgi:NADH:quinone reductase (non-electrogenic)